MAISAKEVMKLRNLTGAGMMDCKKALTESEGDFDKAMDHLRKKGQKIADKRADRDAKEGAIFVHINDTKTKAVIIELNCETDFVAKNADFMEMGEGFLALIAANAPADLDALKQIPSNGSTIGEELVQAMGRIGEKIDISKYEVVSGDNVVSYIHPGARVGVAIAFSNTKDAEAAGGRDVAMQIAAMKPVAIDKDDVSQDIVDAEMKFGREKALAEGKPEHIVDKIAAGMLNKYYKNNTLMNQDFVKDTSKTVKQYIKENMGADVSVSAFKRVQLGA